MPERELVSKARLDAAAAGEENSSTSESPSAAPARLCEFVANASEEAKPAEPGGFSALEGFRDVVLEDPLRGGGGRPLPARFESCELAATERPFAQAMKARLLHRGCARGTRLAWTTPRVARAAAASDTQQHQRQPPGSLAGRCPHHTRMFCPHHVFVARLTQGPWPASSTGLPLSRPLSYVSPPHNVRSTNMSVTAVASSKPEPSRKPLSDRPNSWIRRRRGGPRRASSIPRVRGGLERARSR